MCPQSPRAKFLRNFSKRSAKFWRNFSQIFVLQFPGKMATKIFTKNPRHFPRGTKLSFFTAATLGALGPKNPGAFPKAGVIFQQPFFLGGNCPNLGRHSISHCPKIGEVFSIQQHRKICRKKPFQQGNFSGLQKGPAERGHVKKRQKSSKSVKKFFETFRQFSGHVKKRQKSSKSVKKFFDTFRQFSGHVKKRQKSSKSVKKFFDTFRQFSRGTFFPAPFAIR